MTNGRFIGFCLVFAAAIAWSGGAYPAEKMKIVVVTGGHGFEEKPFKAMFGSYPDLDCTFVALADESELFEDISNWPYKAIVLYNMTRAISEKRQQNFVALLDSGIGLVVLHHAIAAFPDWSEYRRIIGAKYFLEDTEENGVKYPRSQWKEGVDMSLRVEDASHPVVAGVRDFILHDETYKGYVLEPDNHLLLSCGNPGSQKEVAWTRTYRNAKVCFIQPGHGAQAYANEHYRRMVLQAIHWTATK